MVQNKKIAKMLKQLSDYSYDITLWLSTTNKYLRQILSHLEVIKKDSTMSNYDFGKERRREYYKKSGHDLKQALRSVNKAMKIYKKMENIIKKASPSLTEEERRMLNDFRSRLEPFKALIINKMSYFRGELKRDFKNIGEVADKGSKNTTHGFESIQKVQTEINTIIGTKTIGLVSMIVLLEDLSKYAHERKLKYLY